MLRERELSWNDYISRKDGNKVFIENNNKKRNCKILPQAKQITRPEVSKICFTVAILQIGKLSTNPLHERTSFRSSSFFIFVMSSSRHDENSKYN